jgi:hypothetical protein
MYSRANEMPDYQTPLSKLAFVDAGVPCVPGYHGTIQDPQHLLYEAEKIGASHVFNISSDVLILLSTQDSPSLSRPSMVVAVRACAWSATHRHSWKC